MSNDVEKVPDLREYLSGAIVPEAEDPAITAMRIVEQVLTAETAEQIFDLGGSTSAQELVNVPFTIMDVQLRQSEVEGALPVYVLIDAQLSDSGERVPINSGAPRLMAQAWRAKQLDLLPIKVQVVEVAKAKPGQSAPLGLAAL